MVASFDDGGRALTNSILQTKSDLKPATYQDVLIGGFRMHQEVDVPVAASTLRLSVLDEMNRHLGTLEHFAAEAAAG